MNKLYKINFTEPVEKQLVEQGREFFYKDKSKVRIFPMEDQLCDGATVIEITVPTECFKITVDVNLTEEEARVLTAYVATELTDCIEIAP